MAQLGGDFIFGPGVLRNLPFDRQGANGYDRTQLYFCITDAACRGS